MKFFSKLIKPLLAIALAGAVLSAEQGCSKPPAAPASPPGEPRTLALTVTEKGYEPSPVTLQQGQPVLDAEAQQVSGEHSRSPSRVR